jgi:hypothetical protein
VDGQIVDSPAARLRRHVVVPIGVAVALFALLGAFIAMHRFFDRKFHVTTGAAEWIWPQRGLASGDPEVFFAARDFELTGGEPFVRVKVAGDPEYTLFFNGEQIGGGRTRPGDEHPLDVYDVSTKARAGRNRIVLAVRSARGVGGVLASVDLGPMRRNAVVSDAGWTMYGGWNPQLPLRDVPGAATSTPRVLGKPPFGRWRYPAARAAVPYAAEQAEIAPRETVEYDTTLPRIVVLSGVAVLTSIPTAARAFDFGEVIGRVRLRTDAGDEQRVIRIRFAHARHELLQQGIVEELVVAPGESVVTDPGRRPFRFVVVYESDAEVTVVVDRGEPVT